LRIRVFGSKASLTWHQENPNYLVYDGLEGPRQILTRGSSYLSDSAKKATRLPTGHPEAFLEAFANVYLGAAEAMRALGEGRELGPLEGDYPTIFDGARGVHFIHKTVESSKSDVKWLEAAWER